MEDRIKEEIEQFKQKKDVVILDHYYVDGEVQALAVFVADELKKIVQRLRRMSPLYEDFVKNQK